MFSDHNGIKLEVNNRTVGISLNTWKLNSVLLNNPQSKQKSKGR